MSGHESRRRGRVVCATGSLEGVRDKVEERESSRGGSVSSLESEVLDSEMSTMRGATSYVLQYKRCLIYGVGNKRSGCMCTRSGVVYR
jgi:hypothetical protein